MGGAPYKFVKEEARCSYNKGVDKGRARGAKAPQIFW